MPSDGANLYSAYKTVDASLVDKGHPPTSKAWLRALRAFWLSGVFRMVVRKGRQVGASTIVLPRVAAATILGGEYTQSRGTRRTILCTSTRQKESDERLYNSDRTLHDLGIRTRVRGDTIELPGRPVVIQSYPSSADVGRGGNYAMCWEDEQAFWRDGDGVNPAEERDAAIVPGCASHENARIYSVSSAGSEIDFHARLVDLGDTEHQRVYSGPTWLWRPELTEAKCRKLQPIARLFDREFGGNPSASAFALLNLDEVDASQGRDLDIEFSGPRALVLDPSSGKACDWAWGVCHWVRVKGSERDILHFDVVDALERGFSERIEFSEVVSRLAAVAKKYGVTTVHSDQREEYALASAFRAHGLRFIPHPWTGANKPAAIATMRRWFADRILSLPKHDRMHKQLLSFEERFVPSSGEYTAGPRTGRDDFVSLIITAALSDIAGSLRRYRSPHAGPVGFVESYEIVPELR